MKARKAKKRPLVATKPKAKEPIALAQGRCYTGLISPSKLILQSHKMDFAPSHSLVLKTAFQ